MSCPKVLFVGVYRDGTGWGQAATDYILAMDAAGIDVVPRPLKLNDRQVPVPPRILELEQKSASGCEVAIQHVLPHQAAYNGRMKNICLFASETSDFTSSSWGHRLNGMDEVWVINSQQVVAARNSGVTRPIKVIPHATDVARFTQTPPPFSPLKKQEGEYIFYSIGEFVRRKNWSGLLKAYIAEFSHSEPVRLVLKLSVPGKSPEAAADHVLKFCEEIRSGLKIKEMPPITILTQRYSDEEILSLHHASDCFVSTSFGEAWCLPAFDAACMGNQVIAPYSTGFTDWGLHVEHVHFVSTQEEIPFGAHDTFEDLYTGREYWYAPNLVRLKAYMRSVFETFQKEGPGKLESGLELAQKYSHAAVGGMISKALLNEQKTQPKST